MSGEELLTLVERILSTDWITLSRDDVKALWPGTYKEKVFPQPGRPVRTLYSLSRVGRGGDYCDCCEHFDFEARPLDGGLVQENLVSVSIFQSDTDRVAVLRQLELLLRRIVPSDERNIGSLDRWGLGYGESFEAERTFECTLRRSPEVVEQHFIDVTLSHHDGMWSFFFKLYDRACSQAAAAQGP